MIVLVCCDSVGDVVEKLNEELSNVQQISSTHTPASNETVSIAMLPNVLPLLVAIGC